MENDDFSQVLSEVIKGLKQSFFKRKDLILKLGTEIFKTTSDPESVCEQIKHCLREVILDGILACT
ncbi:MAG TPA: hypothetical protein VJM74_06060 [Nitrososphaeraceae archaeon]|nr:hypothetical protein [Nitrososphaeraceae archaeon]